MPRHSLVWMLLACTLVLLLVVPTAGAMTSHAGWPHITGMLLMNKSDQSRPLDGRPGMDPFGGTDPSYSCDGLHLRTTCLPTGVAFAPPISSAACRTCRSSPASRRPS